MSQVWCVVFRFFAFCAGSLITHTTILMRARYLYVTKPQQSLIRCSAEAMRADTIPPDEAAKPATLATHSKPREISPRDSAQLQQAISFSRRGAPVLLVGTECATTANADRDARPISARYARMRRAVDDGQEARPLSDDAARVAFAVRRISLTISPSLLYYLIEMMLFE